MATVKKGNSITLRVNEKMDDWLDDQCELLGMNKSEVIRFWLQSSMITFDQSVKMASKIVTQQLPGQMSFVQSKKIAPSV